MKRHSLVIAILLAALGAQNAFAAIQPALVNTYGNNVTLAAGNSTIWDRTLTEADFISKHYAIIGRSADKMSWRQNEANSLSLVFSTTSTWAGASVVYHFVAPEGQQFSGGTIRFSGVTGDYSGAISSFSLRAVASYSVDQWAVMTVNNVYAEDTHATTAGWVPSTYTVSVPTGKTEFYVIISVPDNASQGPWYAYYGQSLTASNITYAPVPEPAGVMMAGGGLAGLLLLGRARR